MAASPTRFFGDGSMSDLFESILTIPQDGDDWIKSLKWMIAVMDEDDSYLELIVGILGQAIKFDGLTPKQEATCARTLSRLKESYQHGRLKIFGWQSEKKPATKTRIRLVSGGAS
jgi:hypothetical protein